jgi:ArsR family transcriptional regulator, virulence genes transcriptional regulator
MVTASIFEYQAELCRSMSNAGRLIILHTLPDGPKRVNEIAQITELSQAAVSRHLSVLRQNKIVVARRQTHDMVYSIANPKVIEVCNLMREVLTEELTHSSDLIESLRDQS